MDFMGSEVHRMRLGVDELTVEVEKMVEGVEPLEGKLAEVSSHIERLEPKLDELRDTLHPLRRVGKRMGSRREEPVANGGNGQLAEPIGELFADELGQTESGELDSDRVGREGVAGGGIGRVVAGLEPVLALGRGAVGEAVRVDDCRPPAFAAGRRRQPRRR